VGAGVVVAGAEGCAVEAEGGSAVGVATEISLLCARQKRPAAPRTARNAMMIDTRSSLCIAVLAGNVDVVVGGGGMLARAALAIDWLATRLPVSRSRRILRSSA
jgi:hypothetical protein